MSQLLPLSPALSGPPAASAAWRWVRLRALLAVLLLGGMLTTAHPPAARAAATLTASENPVVMPFTVTQEEIVISWNTDNGHEGIVQVAENDGPESKPFPSAKTGSKKFTVQYGSTYHFTLYDKKNNALLAKLDVTTTHPAIKIDTDCLVQCITNVDLDVHGTFADVVVDTNEVAMIVVQASTEAPNLDGTFINKPVAAMTFSLPPKTHLVGQLVGLEPDTTYHWSVLAEDTKHQISNQRGMFTTLQRIVSATLTQICVWDDSDDLSAGDLAFSLEVGVFEKWEDRAIKFWPQSDPGDDWASSGGPCLQPNVTVTLANPPPQVNILVTGFDEDTDDDAFSYQECRDRWGGPPYFVCDEVSDPPDWEESYNYVEISTDALDEGDTSGHGFDFVVGLDDGSRLYFSVVGHYTVTYA